MLPNDDNRYDGVSMISEQSASYWYAAYTKPRHEKSLAKFLEESRVECFLPLIEKQRKWSDRITTVEVPLFSGYLFVKTAWDNRFAVIDAPGYVNFVKFGDSIAQIPEGEIEALRVAVQNFITIDPYPFLKKGTPVRVKRVPLQGFEGILEEKNKKHRLILSVNIIERSVAVEIDAADVEPV